MSDWSEEQLKNALREDLRARWKIRLQEREAGLGNARSIKRFPIWSWAAVIAALAAVSLWLFLPDPTSSHTELFAEYFTPLPNTLAPEIRGPEQETTLQQALQQYDASRYEDALPLFDRVVSDERTEGYFLYRGITELALHRGQEAEISLKQITHETFQFSAQWYVALAYLQQGRKEACRKQLEAIHQLDRHPFRDKAEQLLEEL